MKQQVILFDFDNTLVDSLKYWYKILNKDMFLKYNKKIDKDFPNKRKGLSNLEIAQLFVDVTGVNRTAEEINQEVNQQMEIYYHNNVKFLKGAKEFLVKLKSEGKTLAIITATDLYLVEIALKHFGIFDLFSGVFSEKDVGRYKRNRDFFEYCFAKIKCAPEDVFMFEDAVGSLKSAISIGVECCGVIHKYNKTNIKKLGVPLIRNYKNIKY